MEELRISDLSDVPVLAVTYTQDHVEMGSHILFFVDLSQLPLIIGGYTYTYTYEMNIETHFLKFGLADF